MEKYSYLMTLVVCVILAVLPVSLSDDPAPDTCTPLDNVNGTCCNTTGCQYVTCNKTEAPANVTSACYAIGDPLTACVNTTVKNECKDVNPTTTTAGPTPTPAPSVCKDKAQEDCCNNKTTCQFAQCEGEATGGCYEKTTEKKDICEGGNFTNVCSVTTTTAGPTPTTTPTPAPSVCKDKEQDACCKEDTCQFAQCEGETTGVCLEKTAEKKDICSGGKFSDLCSATPSTSAPSSSTAAPPTCAGKSQDDCCAAEQPSCQFINCTDSTDKLFNVHQACHDMNDPSIKDVCVNGTISNLCKTPTGSPPTPTGAQPNTGGGEDHPQHFDFLSFMGGIILCGGLVVIAVVGLKIYRAKTERNYHTLH